MYLDYVKNNSTTQALFNDRLPFTKPSAIYSNLGKDALKKYGASKEFEDIIDSLWDRELTRSDVFDIFRKENLYKGFIAAMLWGGLGSDALSRNNLRYAFSYPKAEIEEILTRISKLLKEDKVGDAFESMLPKKKNKISGVGISFFTKLLYFLWPSENTQSVKPLIYDKWGWHIHAAILMEESGMDAALNYYNVSATINHDKDYGLVPQIVLKDGKKVKDAYLDYLKKLSAYSKGEPGRLEEFLFGQSRKVNKAASNPRVYLMQCLAKQIDTWFKNTDINYSSANEEDEPTVGVAEENDGGIPGRPHIPEHLFTKQSESGVFYVYVASDKKKRFCEIWNPKLVYTKVDEMAKLGFEQQGGQKPYFIKTISEYSESEVANLLNKIMEIL